jgi:carboxyl-terminal processing protease
VFNNKHPSRNPVTGETLTPTPFLSTTQSFRGSGVPAGQALPSLDLNAVYVITGPGTCSASESIINGLRGVGVSVYVIGSTTCGKPYGFYPTDNCGTTYFTIQFRGENAANFGDYTDGFSPANQPVATRGTVLPGCSVADDFSKPMGDPTESRRRSHSARATTRPARRRAGSIRRACRSPRCSSVGIWMGWK